MITQTLITLAADQQPAAVPTGSPGAAGYGGIILGVAVGAYVVAKWGHTNKDGKKMFILGVILASLLGVSGGIFGVLGNSVRQTGDSVGNSITQTTTGR